jgi:probable rRNA maturation factor
MSIRISVQRSPRGSGPPRAALLRWVRATLVGHRPKAEVVLRIVDSDEGATLNATWRGKQGPTNVLSFPVGEPPSVAPDLLGDLVLCAPVVCAEAREQGKTTDAHWAHLVIHGTLHLLGFDHQRARDARVMESLERDILSRLGYPDPYKAR